MLNQRTMLSAPALAALALLAGCDMMTSAKVRYDARYYVKPTVAVSNFQASAAPQGTRGWNVGSGLADALTDELVKTGRFHVVDRANIDQVLSELKMQQSSLTREEGRSKLGMLKNVEYFVEGRVTDFGHVSSNDGWARMDMMNAFGQALQGGAANDVSSGRSPERADRADQDGWKARCGRTRCPADATYKNVGFGGSAFYRTPLGKVTADATRKVVLEMVSSIASQPWTPRISLVADERIIINGGKDRGIAKGDLYQVVEHGRGHHRPGHRRQAGQLAGPADRQDRSGRGG